MTKRLGALSMQSRRRELAGVAAPFGRAAGNANQCLLMGDNGFRCGTQSGRDPGTGSRDPSTRLGGVGESLAQGYRAGENPLSEPDGGRSDGGLSSRSERRPASAISTLFQSPVVAPRLGYGAARVHAAPAARAILADIEEKPTTGRARLNPQHRIRYQQRSRRFHDPQTQERIAGVLRSNLPFQENPRTSGS
jgi:hypothetical protein